LGRDGPNRRAFMVQDRIDCSTRSHDNVNNIPEGGRESSKKRGGVGRNGW
jgi:hypothetical protein